MTEHGSTVDVIWRLAHSNAVFTCKYLQAEHATLKTLMRDLKP